VFDTFLPSQFSFRPYTARGAVRATRRCQSTSVEIPFIGFQSNIDCQGERDEAERKLSFNFCCNQLLLLLHHFSRRTTEKEGRTEKNKKKKN
jgi:hypothetical protein